MEPSNADRPGLRVETADGVARVVLDRPDRRNALSAAMLSALEAAIDRLASDRSVAVVVIAGEGPAFCAGHDLAEMRDAPGDVTARLFADCSRTMRKLRGLPQPVIARVQGPAVAAGCQLVAACDLAVAADTATFSTPGVKIGLFCTTPMVPLVRTIAPRAALEMLMTGRPISAARALEWGLLNRVVAADRLEAEVSELVADLRSASPAVLALGKRAFYRQLAMDEPSAYDDATRVMAENAGMPSAREGIAAFLEKRRPDWPRE